MARAPRIPDLYERQPRCRICRDLTRVGYVDSQLARGITATSISRTMTGTMNLPTTPQLILSHQKHYVPPVPDGITNKEDLAILIRDQVLKAVKTGALEPSITHGLQAEALIQRREERQGDGKNLLAAMARILSGASAPVGYLPPPELVIIEGVAEEVE